MWSIVICRKRLDEGQCYRQLMFMELDNDFCVDWQTDVAKMRDDFLYRLNYLMYGRQHVTLNTCSSILALMPLK
jgi:hypothetical protein